MDDFLIRAALAGGGIAILAAGLGCLVVWRRMAYFGDSLSHSALLGIGLGFLTGVHPQLGAILVCATFAILLVTLQSQERLPMDTLLGILAHTFLATGIIVINALPRMNLDWHGYLFGSLLTVSNRELIWLGVCGAIILTLLIRHWSSLVLMTISEDLARAEGARIVYLRLLTVLLMALFVSVAFRVVGVLLITAMLIIPAATARPLARSPHGMALLSAAFGLLAVFIGLWSSLHWDLPSGPGIVAAAAAQFLILFTLTSLLRRP